MTGLSLNIPVSAAAVPEAAAQVAQLGAEADLDPQACFQVQVVVAEALNNIVHHGMARTGLGTIQIQCRIVDHALEINIRDRGVPFGRLPSERFPDSRAEHGRGWPIIVNWADHIEYHVTPRRNELTLRKRLA